MDKNQKLLNETRKRMKQLYEYSYYNSMDEVGDDQNQNDGGQDPMGGGGMPGGQDPMGGGMPGGQDPMGGDPNAMGGDPNAMGGDPNAMGGDPNAMGGDPNAMGGDPNAMGGGGIDGANLAPNAGMDGGQDPNAMGGDPNAMGGDPNAMGDDPMGGGADMPGADDDVIDITQLVDSQDELKSAQDNTNDYLEDVDDKLTTLLNVVNKFSKVIDANDEKIAELKRELVKRTPTEEETMNVRLNAGGNPFDQKPEEFWDKFKDINNHYNITANNDAPQYQIKKSDIDNVNDRMINDELDDENDYPRTLHEYFVR